VTVLVTVGRIISQTRKMSPAAAISQAATSLGYAAASDPYGLQEKAAEILAADYL
jgi:hypothetical protein